MMFEHIIFQPLQQFSPLFIRFFGHEVITGGPRGHNSQTLILLSHECQHRRVLLISRPEELLIVPGILLVAHNASVFQPQFPSGSYLAGPLHQCVAFLGILIELAVLLLVLLSVDEAVLPVYHVLLQAVEVPKLVGPNIIAVKTQQAYPDPLVQIGKDQREVLHELDIWDEKPVGNHHVLQIFSDF